MSRCTCSTIATSAATRNAWVMPNRQRRSLRSLVKNMFGLLLVLQHGSGAA